MKRFLAMCLGMTLALITPPQVFAQSGGYRVQGVVVDESGVPVIGATILEKDAANGTTTDIGGQYALTVKSPASVVEVSFLGYKTVEYVANSTELARVVLAEDLQTLDEVVVIGYGSVKKNDMTGSVVAIKAEEVNRGAMVTTQDMLQGKVPGLQVIPGDGGPDSRGTIRIRGAASLNASNDPLIVIDGVPIASDGGKGMANPLSMVNPNDIESFTVLKDASATAIYGSRASNGVIIITTKKGKGNSPRVSYNGSVSVQTNSKRIDVMKPEEYRQFVDEVYPAGNAKGDYLRGKFGEANTDWQDLIFRTAISHDHNVSVYGNYNEVLPYRASVGYTGQQGTLHTSHYDRGTLDLSLSPAFFKKHLTVSLNAKGLYTSQRYADGGTVGKAAFFDPTADPYFRNEDGSIDYTTTNGYYNYGIGRGEDFAPNTLLGVGPLSQLYDKDNTARVQRFIGNAQIDYKVHGFEALRFNLNLGLDVSQARIYDGVNPGSFQAYSDTEAKGWGQFTKKSNFRRNQLLEFYGNFNKEWGIHHLDAMVGYSWQHFYSSDHDVTYFNETGEQKGEDSRYPFNRQENYLVSFYGRINYSIASKYLLTVTLRGDGSSKFSEDNRWGIFPSAALAWNIAEEKFLKDSRAVSALKLRAGYGQTGQQEIGENYGYLARYSRSTDVYKTYNMGNAGYCFHLLPHAYDPNITWETTTTWNVGLDFGFLNGRINGSVDWYLRKTEDLLNTVVTPMGANFGNKLLTNVGTMENKGVEFSLNLIPVRTKDWNVSIGFNGTFQNIEFTKLTNGNNNGYYVETGSISKGTGNMLMRHVVGSAPYQFFCYQQLYDAAGNPIQNAVADRDGDGVITQNDRYATGKTPNPDFFYGLNVKVQYKNWDFGFNGHGSVGNWIFNDFASANSTSNIDINSGAVPNFARTVKRTGFVEANSGEQWYSDLFLEDASFFRLDDVNLGYTFDRIRGGNTSIRIAFGVQNLFVITDYTGTDPEITFDKDRYGIDGTIWPRPRTYSLRLNVNF